jgi:integrase/recombinase XerC
MSHSQFLDYLLLEKKYSPNTTKAYDKDLESFSAKFIKEEFEQEDIKEV